MHTKHHNKPCGRVCGWKLEPWCKTMGKLTGNLMENVIIRKDCSEYIWARCSKRRTNIVSVEEVHVLLPHASVKKGVSVLRSAQASGPHVVGAWSCKLSEEITVSVSLPGGLSRQLGERILCCEKGVQNLISGSVHLVYISIPSNRVSGWMLSRCCYQGKRRRNWIGG